MLIRTTLTYQQMLAAVKAANDAGDYDGNLIASNLRTMRETRNGFTYRMRLVPRDSRRRGARFSPSGRHCAACSWEAFRDFMRAIYAQDPGAMIATGFTTYRSAEHFERTHGETRNKQVGSLANPIAFGDLSIT